MKANLPSRAIRTVAKPALMVLTVIAAIVLDGAAGSARALTPISVDPDQERIEITGQGEIHAGRGDTLQVETAPGVDGVSGRMSVRASTPGTNPNWIVFALHNPSDKAIERWLTAERYTVVGSSVIWPDLDARRIEAVTPSLGYLPERVKSDRADIFRITLDKGETITFVAELSLDRFPRVYLWKPFEYELKARDRQLFNGIMLGITGLLALFLTAVFAANHKAIFPAASLVAWCVLGYLCVDFGFWPKLFQLRPDDNAVYRAATESAIAASLVIFLGVFLRLAYWHAFIRMLVIVWIAAQLGLIAVAVIDPRLAATFARASFVAIGGVGSVLTLYLALRGQDRALSLVPTWLLLLVWIFAAGVTLTGRLSGDVVVSGLVAGLVLIVLLLGFTVTQYAFRSYEPFYGAAPSELQIRAQAVDGAGAAVWEWLARRDEIKVSPVIDATLGLSPGELSAKVEDFAKHLHPADRERFRLLLWSLQERNGGNLHIDFRMRHADNSYRWFEIEAASVPHADRKALRCIGLMRDITEAKRSQERLMHDAVHDSLTGLPNRELFLDRLQVAFVRTKTEASVRPTILFIDIDKFKSVNSSLGLIVGDSLLLTVARRLMRHLGPQDTLARIGGDQFAIMLIAHQEPRELALLAERMRRSLRSPIKIAGKEIVLTASTGIAVFDGSETSAHDLLKEAEIAMYRAKRGGADRVEIFRAEMRSQPDDRIVIESELRRAIERRQIRIMYQPIVYLPTEELAGFEALVRWEHPKMGMLNPVDFVPVAEESDLIAKLGSYVLSRAAHEASRWHKELPRAETPLFVSVNVSTRQLFRQDLVQEIRHVVSRTVLPPGALRLEVTESLVMENPEQAVQVLEVLRSAGAGLSIDDFGAGYSSLTYLQRFPFDTIKIDRGLVQSVSGDGPGAAIVRSIVALAHELGKKVVAEGIEEVEDAQFLRSLGCEYAQGYYYGEPMSDRDALQLLKVINKSEGKLHRRGFFRKAAARKRRKSTNQDAPTLVASASAPPLPVSAAPDAPLAGQAGPVDFLPVEQSDTPTTKTSSGQADKIPSKRVKAGRRLFGKGERPPVRVNGNGAHPESRNKSQSVTKAPAQSGSIALGSEPQPPSLPTPAAPSTRPPPPPNGRNGLQHGVAPPPLSGQTPTGAPPPLRTTPTAPGQARPALTRTAPPPVRTGPPPPVTSPGESPMRPSRMSPPPAPRPEPGDQRSDVPLAKTRGTPPNGRPAPAPTLPPPVPTDLAKKPRELVSTAPPIPATPTSPPTTTAAPQYPTLPPAIAASLEKLAGVPITQAPGTPPSTTPPARTEPGASKPPSGEDLPP